MAPSSSCLMLTACRRGEIAELQWREIDLEAGLITIPAARMKNGAAFVVPVTPAIRELLESLPRGRVGDFVFSNTGGRQPDRRVYPDQGAA